MLWWRGIFAAAALIALFALPARAMTHGEHCEHELAMQHEEAAPQDTAEPKEHHLIAPATVEQVPHSAKNETCPHLPGQPCHCKSRLMIGCNMKSCGVEADGPLSTGLKDRSFGGNDSALCIHPAHPFAGGRLVNSVTGIPISPRDLPGPDPRPPSA